MSGMGDLFGDDNDVTPTHVDDMGSNPYETGGDSVHKSNAQDDNNNDNDTGYNAPETTNENRDDDVFGDVEVPSKEHKQSEDQEPTVLSVWLESRRQILEERKTKEKEEQEKLQKQAKDDIQKFHDDRKRRVEEGKKQNRLKERQLREDLQSVFEYGTIWEQVARMVNLQEATDKRGLSGDQERMRNLLIQLKNEKKPSNKGN